MWRDPMDELIDDLERVLPAKQQTEWGELLVEFQIWTDRILSTPLRPEDLNGRAGDIRPRGRPRLPGLPAAVA